MIKFEKRKKKTEKKYKTQNTKESIYINDANIDNILVSSKHYVGKIEKKRFAKEILDILIVT